MGTADPANMLGGSAVCKRNARECAQKSVKMRQPKNEHNSIIASLEQGSVIDVDTPGHRRSWWYPSVKANQKLK